MLLFSTATSEPLLIVFLATEDFSGGGSQISFVLVYEGNLVEVMVCAMMA